MTATPKVFAQIEVRRVFDEQRLYASGLRQTHAYERIQKLRRLSGWIEAHEKDIKMALHQDFGKSPVETDITEIFSVLTSIHHTIGHLRDWMKPKAVPTSLIFLGAHSYVQPEPKGVSLIIAPWNYPFYLAINPLIYAIAAGNTAIVKPSEMTPKTSQVIRRMIAETFTEHEVAVVEGGVDTSSYLLSLPFDHIFFTGSPSVGKVVMKAAAAHLTSVTLELGGKSPAIIGHDADIIHAAEKITWGKWVNNGQTCIAPDYVLVPPALEAQLVQGLKAHIDAFYDPDGQGIIRSASYARIINDRHFERLRHLITDAVAKGAQIVIGGQMVEDQRFIAPTVLTGVRPDMAIMQEEIFGPVLPLVRYESRDEAIRLIEALPKPLALYVFGQDADQNRHWIRQTTAGGTCINDCLLHISNPDLPFGGVNNSGIGKSHGYHGFLAFSNERAIFAQRTGWTTTRLFYPPYTPALNWLVQMAKKLFA